MRIAIFSDVHGNLSALEAVLAEIDRLSPDIIAFAGDVGLFGPRAAACLELLKSREIVSIYGNTDKWILEPPVPPDNLQGPQLAHRQHLYEISGWTQAHLSESQLAWLAALPFQHRFSPGGIAEQDLLMVHANPIDVNQVIYPTDTEQERIFGEVQQAQSDEELAPLLDGTAAGVLAFGHLHIPNIRQWQGIILANISSVSLPGDNDPRAKYGLLDWDSKQGWSIQKQTIAYDIAAEKDALAASRQPKWQSYAKRLDV